MPEVRQVETIAEDVVDLTVKAEQPTDVEESATLVVQQAPQPAEESAEMMMLVQKAEEKVGQAPKVLVRPEPKVVQEGETVVFECQMTGEPLPEVQTVAFYVLDSSCKF